MLLSLFRTSGHSMESSLKNGSFFIASNIPYKFNSPGKGDIVLFEHGGKQIVKRIFKISNNKYFVEGENKKDSKKFAPIKRSEILSKVIWTF